METNELIKKGIGENILERKNLAKERVEILDKIIKTINDMKQDSNCNEPKRDYNNFISILGGRGSGKSSMILTVLNELRKEDKKLDYSYENRKITYDFIVKKIDPLMFNLEKNALGWIIYSFDERINQIKTIKNNAFCDDITIKIDELEKKYKVLTENYIISRDFYRDNLAVLSEGKKEYKNINEDIIKADLKLEEAFSNFIEFYVDTIKNIFGKVAAKNGRKDDEENSLEPYIIIPFDDIDIRPQYGPEILDTIIKYLKHKNIIVIISGDYSTFKESLFIDLWRKQNAPNDMDISETLIDKSLKEQILQRADDILNKVMPPAYVFKLDELSIFDRLTYTPYGAEGDSIANLLSKFKIGKESASKDSEQKYEGSLLDYFVKPLIDTKKIDKEIKDMKEKRKNGLRVYNGFDYDVCFYEDNEIAIKCYEKLNKLYDENGLSNEEIEDVLKFIANIRPNEEFKDIKNEEEKEIQDKTLSFNNKEKILFRYITSSSIGQLLPDTPRGLINLYHSLYIFLNENLKEIEEVTKEFLFLNLDVKTPKKGQGANRDLHIGNYNNIYKLLEIFKGCNIDLKYTENKKIVDDVISFDYDNKIIFLDFKTLELESNEFYYNKVINITNSIKTYIARPRTLVHSSVSSLIELAYDLSKEYLMETNINIRTDKDLSKIVIYNRDEDKTKVLSENFDTFREFYVFQSMYKILIPLIIKDLKVHRNIRDRLRVYLYNVMLNVINGDKNNGLYKYENIVTKLADITKNESNKNEYLEEDCNYFGRNLAVPNDLVERPKYYISEFILYFNEKGGYFFGYFKDIVSNDEKLDLYNNICLNLTSSKTYLTRCIDLKDIIEESNYPIKYFEENNRLNNLLEKAIEQIENYNKLMKECKDEEKKKNIRIKFNTQISGSWSEITKEIILVSMILVGNMIVKSTESDNDYLRNMIYTNQLGLIVDLRDKINNLNFKGKNRNEVNNNYKELTGLEINNRPDSFKYQQIKGFLTVNDYWTESCQKYVELLAIVRKNTAENELIKYIDEKLEEIEDSEDIESSEEKERITKLKEEKNKLSDKRFRDKNKIREHIEGLVKDLINFKNIG